MHASGKLLFALCSTLTVALLSGCRTPQADRSVQVTQRPSGASDQVDVPRTRLAYSKKLPTGENTATVEIRQPFSQGAATASINDDGQSLAVQPAAHRQPSAEEQQLLDEFRGTDPRVFELARRRLNATQQTSIETKPIANLPTRAELAQGPLTAPPDVTPIPESTPPTVTTQFVMPASHSEPLGEPADARRPAAQAADATSPVAAPLLDSESVTEQLATAPTDGSAPADADAADPKAIDEPSPLAPWSDQRLLAELATRFAQIPEEADDAALLRHHMRHRMLLMLSGRIDEAVEPIEGMGSSEHEYLRNQLLAMWTALDPQGHPVLQRRWAAALPHLREATSHMAAATGTLDVRSLAFCTEVESFGRITPFASTRFKSGQQVILYSEVDGFAAERLSTGYETQFQGSYEIFDASGKRLHQKVLPADQQVCNNYRRDYFIAYRLHLPSQLAVGKYRLELTMEDLKGEKYGQSSIGFEITGSVAKPHTGG